MTQSGKDLPRGEAISLRQISHPRSHVVIRVGQHQSSLCYLWALSTAWQCLARLPTPPGLSQDLNPRATKMESPRLRMHLLCALAARSERCGGGGLRTTPCGFLRFPHATPKPDRPLEQSWTWKRLHKQKTVKTDPGGMTSPFWDDATP